MIAHKRKASAYFQVVGRGDVHSLRNCSAPLV